MQLILQKLEELGSWKQWMRKSCRSNKLSIEIVAYFTPLKIKAIYSKFQSIYRNKKQIGSRWLENELRAFYWICVAVSHVQKKLINSFDEQDWDIIANIFYFKKQIDLKYQAKKLIDNESLKIKWTPEEDQMITQILCTSPSENNKWNQYAKKLFALSNKIYFRTGKQCRQRWLNHLDPSKKHGDWTIEEDIMIAKLFVAHEKKWSLIAQKLGGYRTQHMVKNRYKTIIIKQRKQQKNQSLSDKNLMKHFVKSAAKIQQKCQIERKQDIIKIENRSSHIQKNSEERSEVIHSKEKQAQNIQVENIQPCLPSYELSQVFSPWYVITPTFSPNVSYFVNVPTFASFESQVCNQFYCPQTQKQA